MATRLFPRTEDAALLERLAGVEAGTAARLAELEAEAEPLAEGFEGYGEYQAACFAFLDRLRAEPGTDRLHSFKTSGWGRVTANAGHTMLAADLDSVCGSAEEPGLVAELLRGQGNALPAGVSATYIKGVYWL